MIRLLLIAVVSMVAFPVFACGFENGFRAETDDLSILHYRIKTKPLQVAQHFSMQFQYCRDGQVLALDRFKLDALMPAHGHGMNYAAKVIYLDNGIVETSGLLFHMPGHWQLVLDFEQDGVARHFKLDLRI
jgi:hypothetical protein